MRLFQRHWAGAYALPVSFFAISLLSTVILFFYTRFAALLALRLTRSPLSVLMFCLISLVLIWAVTAWQYGGTLRSARRYRSEHPDNRGVVASGLAMTVLTVLLVPILLTSKTLTQVGATMMLLLLGAGG